MGKSVFYPYTKNEVLDIIRGYYNVTAKRAKNLVYTMEEGLRYGIENHYLADIKEWEIDLKQGNHSKIDFFTVNFIYRMVMLRSLGAENMY